MIMMPINLCHENEVVTVRKIKGKDLIRNHLNELGFVEGSTVKVVSKSGNSVILQVKESRVALDATMAKRVLV
jgi:ferrous iron transport protein A